MKIIIITQNEPFFIPKLLDLIIKKYENYLKVIVFLKPDKFKNKLKSFTYYFQFWGLKQFIKFGIKFLKHKITKTIKLNGVRIIKNIDVNSKTFISIAKKVDYIISIASNQIFKDDLLCAPKELCLNIHASLLPKNKGYNPSFWVLYKNESYTGITLHKMNRGLDSGPNLIQKKMRIKSSDTRYSLQNRVVYKASEMLIQILPRLIKKDYNLREHKGTSSLFRKPEIKHGIEFRRRGKKFV